MSKFAFVFDNSLCARYKRLLDRDYPGSFDERGNKVANAASGEPSLSGNALKCDFGAFHDLSAIPTLGISPSFRFNLFTVHECLCTNRRLPLPGLGGAPEEGRRLDTIL